MRQPKPGRPWQQRGQRAQRAVHDGLDRVTDPNVRAAWRRLLDGFVVDLGVGEDSVPLERVLRRHRAAFEAVLATGRTWPQIARALTDAGARHKRGQPMSAKQLRTVYGRTGAAHAEHRPATMGDVAPAAPIAEGPARSSVAQPRPTRSVGRASSSPGAMEAAGDRMLGRLAEARRARGALKHEFDE